MLSVLPVECGKALSGDINGCSVLQPKRYAMAIARPVRGRSNTEHRLTAAIFVDLPDSIGTIL